MLTVACLQKNTSLYNALKDQVEILGLQGIAEGATLRQQQNNVSLKSIYNQIRQMGIETDMQTIGAIYNEVMPVDEYAAFMDPDQVERYALRNYQRNLRKAAMLESDTKRRQVGELASERWLANGLVSMFRRTFAPDTKTKSLMAEMQDIMWAAVKDKMNLPDTAKPKNNEGWQDMLERYLKNNRMGVRDVNGNVNTLQDLFNSMRDVIEETKGRMEDVINEEDGDPATLAQFETMVDMLNSTAMGLFFSKGDAKKLLTDIFKKEGYGKTVGNRTVMDWTKLAGNSNSIADLRQHVHEVLDKAGYNNDVIEALKDSMEQQFHDLHGKQLEKNLNEKKMAREATADILEDDDVLRFTGGQSIKEWIENNPQNIETLQQLEDAASQVLADKKFVPGVRSKIMEKLRDYFDRNYAKMETTIAKDAIEKMGIAASNPPKKERAAPQKSTKLTPLQWMTKNGITNVSELRDKLADELDNQRVMDKVSRDNIMNEFERIFTNYGKRAERSLGRRAKIREAADQKKMEGTKFKKGQMQRLAELNNLGVFESQYDKLVNDLAGVPNIQQQDMKELKKIADYQSQLFREIENRFGTGGEMFANSLFQNVQESFNRIVESNMDANGNFNQSRFGKMMKGLKNFSDTMLIGYLSSVRNLASNGISNLHEVLTQALSAPDKGQALRSLIRDNRRIFSAVWRDVAANGGSYGAKVSEFTTSNNFLDDFRVGMGWDTTIPAGQNVKSMLTNKEYRKNLFKTVLFSFSRAGLTAMDAGMKAVVHNLAFNRHMYVALTMHGPKMDKLQAERYMNQQLNGQSFEQAQMNAKDLIEKMNLKAPEGLRKKINSVSINRLANDMVKANVVYGGGITNEVVNAMSNSAYRIASYGLGHDANNIVSKPIVALRQDWRKEEAQLLKDKQWDKLARARFRHSMYNAVFLKFAAGAWNWLHLTVQRSGYGIVRGVMGNINADYDFSGTVKQMEESVHETELARTQMARGFVGAATTISAFMLKYFIDAAGGDDEEERKRKAAYAERLKSMKAATSDADAKAAIGIMQQRTAAGIADMKGKTFYGAIANNYTVRKLFNAFAPQAMLLSYNVDASDDVVAGTVNWITKNLGLDYNLTSKLNDYNMLRRQGDTDGANGVLASVVGDQVSFPFWRAMKDNSQLARYFAGQDVQSDYRQPTTVMEGLFGGGAFEWLAGIAGIDALKANPRITMLDGVGAASYEKYKKFGISTMDDLRKRKGWEYMTDETGKQILNAADRKKAKATYDKFSAQQWGDDEK